MKTPKRRWMEMSAADFRTAEVASWIAVLPVAAVEQHGAHLPVGVDTQIAEGMIATVEAALPASLPAVFLPVQTVGHSDEHMSFAGTLTLSWEAAFRSWYEISRSVARAGIKKIVLVTSHGGNSALIDLLARELRVRHGMLAVHTSWGAHGQPHGVFTSDEVKHGIHGGDVETSLMLAFRPELVDMSRAEANEPTSLVMERELKVLRAGRPAGFGWAAQDLHPSGVMGNPVGATAEKGRKAADYYAEKFIALLEDVQRFDASAFGPIGS